MIRPIFAYGQSILKQTCHPLSDDYPQIESIIDDMWETMLQANGCGLAAPQIGLPLYLFIVDSVTTYE